MDNNAILIIAIVAVVVLFFCFQQKPKAGNGGYVPDEEGAYPPLPDVRQSQQVKQILKMTEDKFHAAYKMCMKECGLQGSSLQQCSSKCRQVFEVACGKVEAECTGEMGDACLKDCQSQGYPADQCTAYCNDAIGYLCDEMDDACQAGVTPV